MNWKYSCVKTTTKTYEDGVLLNIEEGYAVHEEYGDFKGMISNDVFGLRTQDPVAAVSDTREGLIETLECMLEDIREDIVCDRILDGGVMSVDIGKKVRVSVADGRVTEGGY